MKLYCISDNVDTRIGMRLAGIEGVVLHERQEVIDALERQCADPDIGILLITEKLMKLCPDVIYRYKLNRKRPLIVEIPDRHGTADISETITQYIYDAIGIQI